LAARYLITAAVATLIGCAGLPHGAARAAEISVVSANGLRPVLTALAGRFETTSSDRAILTFDETGALLRRIEAGESADVYILPKSAPPAGVASAVSIA
jgi:ABC-type molybdate transport system substrate-binding protein